MKVPVTLKPNVGRQILYQGSLKARKPYPNHSQVQEPPASSNALILNLMDIGNLAPSI